MCRTAGGASGSTRVKISVSIGNSQDVLDRLLDYRADVGVLAQVFRDGRFVSGSLQRASRPDLLFNRSSFREAPQHSHGGAAGARLLEREAGSTTRRARAHQ